MWNIELENEILNEMLSEWESFLFTKEIYWPIHLVTKELPPEYRNLRISAGRLLITIKLLSTFANENQQQIPNLKENLINFDQLINKWKANWERKVSFELPVRIRQWQRAVQELRFDKEYSIFELKNRIQIRVIIELLVNQLDERKTEFDQLIQISDQKYKSQTFESEFLWDEGISSIFPSKDYWYLYRQITHPGEQT
jgi:hypothetical protein